MKTNLIVLRSILVFWLLLCGVDMGIGIRLHSWGFVLSQVTIAVLGCVVYTCFRTIRFQRETIDIQNRTIAMMLNASI